VLDEPTAGVDVELRQTLWQFIARLNKQGHTVLLTTHYLEEAEALCSRIAMLKTGRVVALESTSELLKSASSNVLRFKIDSALPPEFDGKARVTGRIVQLPAHDAHEIERYWPSFARPACAWRMSRSARPISRRVPGRHVGRHVPRRAASPPSPRRPCPHERVANAAVQGSAAVLKSGLPDRGGPGAHRGAVLLIFGHVLQNSVKVYTASSTPPS